MFIIYHIIYVKCMLYMYNLCVLNGSYNRQSSDLFQGASHVISAVGLIKLHLNEMFYPLANLIKLLL